MGDSHVNVLKKCGSKVNFIYNINKQDTFRRSSCILYGYINQQNTEHKCLWIEAAMNWTPDLPTWSQTPYHWHCMEVVANLSAEGSEGSEGSWKRHSFSYLREYETETSCELSSFHFRKSGKTSTKWKVLCS